MTWHVIWKTEAETELRRMFRQAEDRDEIAVAVEMMEAELEADPLSLGESRAVSTRIFFHGPYAMVLEIDEKDFFVYVRMFWRFAK